MFVYFSGVFSCTKWDQSRRRRKEKRGGNSRTSGDMEKIPPRFVAVRPTAGFSFVFEPNLELSMFWLWRAVLSLEYGVGAFMMRHPTASLN
jgi:hypothetical protein